MSSPTYAATGTTGAGTGATGGTRGLAAVGFGIFCSLGAGGAGSAIASSLLIICSSTNYCAVNRASISLRNAAELARDDITINLYIQE